jgi:carbon-monoxide dehydrogenase medium subunit
MKKASDMKAFTFLAPRALEEAVALLDRHGAQARPIAGGQSLLLAMKERIETPAFLVSLAEVPEVHDCSYTSSGELAIGAATTYAALATASFRGWHTAISSVAGNLADRPVRNLGTIGGALCQADPRFDMLTLAVGCDAQVDTVSTSGPRTRPAADLFKAGGGTALAPGEILTRVRFPSADAFGGVAFEKFRRRVFDAALVSVVCALRIDANDRVADARIAVGALAPVPMLAPQTVRSLVGRTGLDDGPGDLAAELTAEVMPVEEDTTPARSYQRELLAPLARRAITRALDQARS